MSTTETRLRETEGRATEERAALLARVGRWADARKIMQRLVLEAETTLRGVDLVETRRRLADLHGYYYGKEVLAEREADFVAASAAMERMMAGASEVQS